MLTFHLQSSYSYSSYCCAVVKADMAEKLLPLVEASPNAMRLAGLPVAFASAVITLIEKVTQVGEFAFKGLANVTIGLLSLRGSDLLKGAYQLTVGLGISLAEFFLVVPFEFTIDLLVTSVAMAINPKYCIDYAFRSYGSSLAWNMAMNGPPNFS